MYAALVYELEQPYNNTMFLTPHQIKSIPSMQRYHIITQLINAEIDEFVEEDFESSAYDSKEAYRDERMAQFCDFLKKDLCSDNYNG